MRQQRHLPLLLPILVFWGLACAQPKVDLELGFGGVVMDGAWNPLRLVARDLPESWLELRIDQGSLRSGAVPAVYRARVGGGRGVIVFEDDVFLSGWRNLSWTVTTAERTVASGSFDPRNRENRPLVLLISNSPGRWQGQLPGDLRGIDIASVVLPERAASYSGVGALLVDGSAPPPSPEALLSAAAAGAAVLLVEPLPASHSQLAALADTRPLRLAAGWLAAVEATGVGTSVASLRGYPLETQLTALLSGSELAPPVRLDRIALVVAGGLYILLASLLLRFGGAGLIASLLLASLLGLAAWGLLRPPEALLTVHRGMTVSAGGLGLQVSATALRTLPGGTVSLPGSLYPREPLRYRVGPANTRLELARWQREVLMGRPLLTTGILEWRQGKLFNGGESTLREVIVKGLGAQPVLLPGESLEPLASEVEEVPAFYVPLLPLLADGVALAHDGSMVHIGLPEGEPLRW